MFCLKIIVAKEGLILKVNEIIMKEIQTFKEDEKKINKENFLADANTLINLGISYLNQELYKTVINIDLFIFFSNNYS